ncbi:MAG: hypothetical protein IPJ35_05490 [Elusimicrobia bacterium]|nr:hypothetical protein [Elusimicrobiota bacterium]
MRSSGPALPTAERLWGTPGTTGRTWPPRLDAAEMAGKSVDGPGRRFFPRWTRLAEAQTNTADFSSNPSQRLLMPGPRALGDPSAAARRAKARFGAEAAERNGAPSHKNRRGWRFCNRSAPHEGAGEASPLLDATSTTPPGP